MTLLSLDPADVTRWWQDAGYDVRRAAEIACAEMERRATAGDAASETLLREWTIGGARQHLKRVFAALDQRLVPANGHPAMRIPGHMSVKLDDGSRQERLWEVMTRAEYDSVVTEYRAQADKRVRTLVLFERVAAAWDADPGIQTAREAFAAAGIDLDQVVAEAFA